MHLLQGLFRPSLEDFDVTIKLSCQELSRRKEAVDWKNPDEKKDIPLHQKANSREIMPVAMYDAASMYLEELKVSLKCDWFTYFHGYIWITVVK